MDRGADRLWCGDRVHRDWALVAVAIYHRDRSRACGNQLTRFTRLECEYRTSEERRERGAIRHAVKSLSVAGPGCFHHDPESAIRHLINADTPFPRPHERGQEIVRPPAGVRLVREVDRFPGGNL